MPAGLLLKALPGLIQAGSSLFGAGRRQREQRRAQAQFDRDLATRRNFQFTNPYDNLENTAEDLTVNQQAAQFQAQQQDQALAQALDVVAQTGGGGGGAQVIADRALAERQNISASIAAQEQANERARVAEASRLQGLQAQGADALQLRQFSQTGINLEESRRRIQQANAA